MKSRGCLTDNLPPLGINPKPQSQNQRFKAFHGKLSVTLFQVSEDKENQTSMGGREICLPSLLYRENTGIRKINRFTSEKRFSIIILTMIDSIKNRHITSWSKQVNNVIKDGNGLSILSILGLRPNPQIPEIRGMNEYFPARILNT